MTTNSHELIQVVTLLAAAVIAIPIFKKIGLGSVLGYLAAGLCIGPFGFGFFNNPTAILHVAELGVVMFLFVIGLEMQPSHLWSLRKDIFGLGSLQILITGSLLTLLGLLLNLPLLYALIAGIGFTLTSTAIVFQTLTERGDVGTPQGRKIFSILLFEDLLIVPLLAIVTILSPEHTKKGFELKTIATPILAMGGIILVGLWVLNPLLRILSKAKAREVLTAAALLVVLGSALLMQMSGLSMAMGAFLAGVLLSQSAFRHQIEADIEPFRGILLGLFFMGVGMSLDLPLVKMNIQFILLAVVIYMFGKALAVFSVAKIMGCKNRESLDRATTMIQGGEFAFVLFAAAKSFNVIDQELNANMTAVIVISMALTPIVAIIVKKLLPPPHISLEGVETPNDLEGSALLIGFGRFGQVVSQLLLARNLNVTIIDHDAERIRNAKNFGFQIYYGDGSRLDVLRASGAHKASFIAVCIDNKETATKIAQLIKHEFPETKVLVRAFDRVHARELVLANVDFQIRETFESAILFGEAALKSLAVSEDEIEVISNDIRKRDRERFEREVLANDPHAGKDLIHVYFPKPDPLIEPKRPTKILNPAEIPQSAEAEK